MPNKLFVFILPLLLLSCGYKFSSDSSIVLPRNQRLLHLSKVVNPTLEPKVEPVLRSSLRDELSRRGQVRWVSKEKAETLVEAIIESFTVGGSLKGADDETVKYKASLVFRVEMFDAKSRLPIWNSGIVTVNESYLNQNSKSDAAREALELACRRVADLLSQNF